MKKIVNKPSVEELIKNNILRDLKDKLERLQLIPEPTRLFKIGEKVRLGGLENPIILESLENNRIYKVEYLHKERY